MKKFLAQAVPMFVRFEHATVIVVGAQFIVEHATSVATLVATLVIFIIFHVVKEG